MKPVDLTHQSHAALDRQTVRIRDLQPQLSTVRFAPPTSQEERSTQSAAIPTDIFQNLAPRTHTAIFRHDRTTPQLRSY